MNYTVKKKNTQALTYCTNRVKRTTKIDGSRYGCGMEKKRPVVFLYSIQITFVFR